jgi:hypothetical protein
MTVPYGYDGRAAGPPGPEVPGRSRHRLVQAALLLALALVSGTVIAGLLLWYYPDQATAAAVWELGVTADGIPLVPAAAGIVLLYLVFRVTRGAAAQPPEEY